MSVFLPKLSSIESRPAIFLSNTLMHQNRSWFVRWSMSAALVASAFQIPRRRGTDECQFPSSKPYWPNQIVWKSLCERLKIERFLLVCSSRTRHGNDPSDSCHVLRVVLASLNGRLGELVKRVLAAGIDEVSQYGFLMPLW